jgi:hypothetical protein
MVETPEEKRPLRTHTNRWVYLNENDYVRIKLDSRLRIGTSDKLLKIHQKEFCSMDLTD